MLMAGILLAVMTWTLSSCSKEKETEKIIIPPAENTADALSDDVLRAMEQSDNNTEIEVNTDMDICDLRGPDGQGFCETLKDMGYDDPEVWMQEIRERAGISGKQSFLTTPDPYANMTPFDAWVTILSDMTGLAWNLVDDDLHQFSYEGIGRPAQDGLAYVYGSKHIDARDRAVDHYGNCTEWLYGLDCSGLIQRLFESANFSIIQGTAEVQHQISTMRGVLDQHPSTSGFLVQNLGEIPPANFWPGDIVYWSQLNNDPQSHIGFISLENSTGDVVVFQSNGSSGGDCAANYGSGRGPRLLRLSNNYWFGSRADWEIVRVTPDASQDCSTLSASGIWDVGNAGTTRHYTVIAVGGTPPYEYSFNFDSYTHDNVFTTSVYGPHVCTIRDSQGCHTTISL